jgi:Protein of unknown function (DUF541)
VGVARLVLAAAVLLLAFPGQALAQFSVPFGEQPAEDYGPGITVSGVGFAPNGQRARATARAVNDARTRAQAVATALAVSLGEVRAVEVASPFDSRPECEPGRSSFRCVALQAVSADVTFAIQGGPTSDEGAREISGTGAANAPATAPRKTSPSIRRTLRAARQAATPDAATDARENAEAAATAAGMGLGPLFSVVESNDPYGYEPLLGVYGAGKFCRRARRVRILRDPDTGERRAIRGRRVLQCFRLRGVSVSLEVTYLGS